MQHGDRPLSALPPVRARVAAFVAILFAGTCGAVIGAAFAALQCSGGCGVAQGVGALVGGAAAAAGVAV
ncbi:MAG: hypothetical protein ACRD0D_13075, partial [Acidimicrobiales bacterium]